MHRILASIVISIAMGQGTARAATAVECLKFGLQPNGDAVMTNGCSDPLNLRWCVEGAEGPRGCAEPPALVVTLHYGIAETIAGYAAAGKSPVHRAVCFYPEAPIDWKPGGGWGCKKTCVMC